MRVWVVLRKSATPIPRNSQQEDLPRRTNTNITLLSYGTSKHFVSVSKRQNYDLSPKGKCNMRELTTHKSRKAVQTNKYNVLNAAKMGALGLDVSFLLLVFAVLSYVWAT